ncbi:hypothetical protein [Zestomonas thermotolerans]|uniref:hypothetical protein n=1 Tax=Zestomonas thermotolerans TaxID=157784 RepID=UPI0012DD055E|nr:hypothetical protein [Pseudomonas thermotolerans]
MAATRKEKTEFEARPSFGIDAAAYGLLILGVAWLFFDSFIVVHSIYTDVPLIRIAVQCVKWFMLIAPPLILILHFGIDWKWLSILLFYLGLIFFYSIIAYLNGYSFDNIMLSLKNTYFWLFYFIYICVPRFKAPASVIRFVILAIFFGALLNVLYSVYVGLTFDGNLERFYFYSLYDQKGMFEDWNFIRDGAVRAFGYVGSKLTLSQLLLIPISVAVMLFFGVKSEGGRTAVFLFLIVLGYGLYLTKTRNPILAISCAICVSLFFRYKLQGWGVVLFFSIFTSVYGLTIYLVFFISDIGWGDLSSQARVPLLISFLEVMRDQPLGYGVGSTGIYNLNYRFFFESSASTVFNELGVVGGAIYWCGVLSIVVVILNNASSQASVYMRAILRGVALSILALLFLTNFSNIFDSSLLVFSIIAALSVKCRATISL